MSKHKEGKKNLFTWIIFAVLLPLLITVIIAVFIMNLAGMDVGGWTKDKLANVPGFSNVIKTNENRDLEAKWLDAEEKNTEQQEMISDLEKEVESLEGIVDDLETDLKKAKKRQENEEKDGEDPTELEAPDDELKQAAASFRKMDAEKAAGIVGKLDEQTAIQILTALPGEVKGNILAEMDAEKAAKLMEAMIE